MRTSSRSSGTHSAWRWRRTKNFAHWCVRQSQGPFLCSIPLVLILFSTCLDFITFEYFFNDTGSLFFRRDAVNFDSASAQLRAGILQKNMQAMAYGLALVLILPQLGNLTLFFFREKGLALIILIILLTALVSDYATKVFTNTVHIGFGLIAAYLFTYSRRGRYNLMDSVLSVVLVCSSTVLLASVLIWMLNYNENLDAFNDGLRYGGFVGNPNNMGWVCMIACWAGLGLAINRKLSGKFRLFAIFAVLIAVICATLAVSVTTFVVLFMTGVLALWHYFVTFFNDRTRRALWATCLSSLIIGGAFFFSYVVGPNSILAAASSTLTGDETLTGRADIWEIGRAAIAERPILGWSYDTHQTVLESAHSIPFFQYHNGFIDTLVSGGLVLFAAVLFQITATTKRTLSIDKQGVAAFPVISFLAIVFVANISEHALLRVDNPIWQTYVVCSVAIAVFHFAKMETKASENAVVNPSGRSSTSSRRTKRMRF